MTVQKTVLNIKVMNKSFNDKYNFGNNEVQKYILKFKVLFWEVTFMLFKQLLVIYMLLSIGTKRKCMIRSLQQ